MAFNQKASSNKTIILCDHCGDMFTSLTNGLCGKCKTPEKRAAMDEENRKIWEENKSKTPFHCAFCDREKRVAAEREARK